MYYPELHESYFNPQFYIFLHNRYGNKFIISSEFKWLAHMISTSRLWTNKVDLAEGDQNDYTLSCMRPLFNFYNRSGNAIRHMLIAECPMSLAPIRVNGSSAQNSCTGTKRLSMQSIRWISHLVNRHLYINIYILNFRQSHTKRTSY